MPRPDNNALMTSVLYRFANPEFVERLQAGYLKYFTEAGAKRVLDLGSGRGIFLRLLGGKDIEAVGVDSNLEQVEACRADGYTVHHDDVLSFLDNAADGEAAGSFDGIFCSHLVEHLSGADAVRLVNSAASLLRPGGRLMLVTPNVANPEVWSHTFWLDPTHVRPYPRPLLESLLEARGLSVVASLDDSRTRRRYGGWDALLLPVDLLRHGINLFSGMDAVVVGELPG